ncbi:MAG TPA: hypothetical protein VN675_14255 [Burkholderiales bacterium]|nr:hypothetical protein [Burkholderiales bacterium]
MSTNTQKQSIDRLSDGAHRVVDEAANRAGAIADRFGEKADELMEMKDDWLEAGRDYVRDHPVAALGIAVAAGYLFSMIMRSRD